MSQTKTTPLPARLLGNLGAAALTSLVLASCGSAHESKSRVEATRAAMQASAPMAEREQAASRKLVAAAESPKPAAATAAGSTGAPAPGQRHIAVRQFLVIESDAASLQAQQQAAMARCQPPGCEVLESSFKAASQYDAARATLRVRIQPAQSSAYLTEATSGGEVIEQRTETEDKTDQVVDTDARLRNLSDLRERLRSLLKTSGAKLADLIEIERELARVQTELDSALGLRKLLAAETERTTLNLDWRARRSLAESGTFATLKNAFTQSGRTLAESLAALVTFLVAVLPWVLVLGAVVQGLRLWWRNRRKQSEDQ